MSKLRVLLIGAYSPPHGGVQGHVVALREYLLRQGVSCQVIDLNKERRTDEAEGVYGPKNAAGVARLLFELRYDIAHMHTGGGLTTRLAALALLCALRAGRRSVFTFHSGGYPSSPQGRADKPLSLRGLAMRRFGRLVGVNEEIAAWFRQVGAESERVRVIHPYALPAEPPEVEMPERIRSFYEGHEPLLISVGLLETHYCMSLQIDALGLLREKFPRAGLVLVGSGSLEDDLRRRIESAPYGEHVLLCGDVDRRVTLRAIAESDLMLRTTLFDGDAISVREAVHFGVPVVATDRAPRPEGVRLFPAQDLERLAEAAELSLRNGGRRAPKNFAHEENMEAVLNLYHELMHESAGR